MIQIERIRCWPLGACRGFTLEIQFDTDVTDQEFEEFAESLYIGLSELRLINFAARIAERAVDIDTSDVLHSPAGREFFIRDVRRALEAAGCASVDQHLSRRREKGYFGARIATYWSSP